MERPMSLELCAQTDLVVMKNDYSFDRDDAAEEVSAPLRSQGVRDSDRAEYRNGEILVDLADAGMLAEDWVVLPVLLPGRLTGHISCLPPVNDHEGDGRSEQLLVNGLPLLGMGGRADNEKNKKRSSQGRRL